jgi:hypothetical protein
MKFSALLAIAAATLAVAAPSAEPELAKREWFSGP